MNHEHGGRYVRVIVDRAIHRELDYSVPESLAERVGVGSRVRVPFRDKSALATVVAIPEQSEAKGIRPIEAIIGEAPILSEQLLELARWIGTYYCCPIETVMRSMLPQVIRRAEVSWKKTVVRATWAQHRPRRNRKTAKTRTAAGGTVGGDFEAGKTDTRGGAPAANLA